MNPIELRRAEREPSERVSGFFPAVTKKDRARAILARNGEVIVVSLCAARALVYLGVNPGTYDAVDAGPIDRDPLNQARYYRVRAKLPSAVR